MIVWGWAPSHLCSNHQLPISFDGRLGCAVDGLVLHRRFGHVERDITKNSFASRVTTHCLLKTVVH